MVVSALSSIGSWISQTAATTPVAAEEAEYVPTVANQAMFGVFLLVFALVLIPALRFLTRELLQPARQPGRSFLWTDLAATLLAFLLGQIVMGGIVNYVYPDMTALSDLGTVAALALTAGGFLAPAVYILFAAKGRPNGLEAVGLKAVTPGYRLPFAGLLYVAGLPLFLGLGALSGALMQAMGKPMEQDVAMLIRDGLADSPGMILLFAVVVVPLLEEILFRGLLLELISSRFGQVAGVLISSAAFAIAHGTAAALPIFGLAIILALVKLRTRSLVAAWFVHALHNGGTTFLLWISTLVPVST